MCYGLEMSHPVDAVDYLSICDDLHPKVSTTMSRLLCSIILQTFLQLPFVCRFVTCSYDQISLKEANSDNGSVIEGQWGKVSVL